ncbi:unnamed protein product, partial [Ectocarpus sp. 12 AP-2014]
RPLAIVLERDGQQGCPHNPLEVPHVDVLFMRVTSTTAIAAAVEASLRLPPPDSITSIASGAVVVGYEPCCSRHDGGICWFPVDPRAGSNSTVGVGARRGYHT